jgi:branched-subunit amino acid ABC-type transport system permease component
MCAVYAGIAFWGLRRLRWRKSASLVIAVIALIMVPLYVLMHDRVLVGEYVQPRYVLPLVVLFAGLVLFDFKRDDLRLSTVQLIVAGALVALANGWSLYVNIRRYVTGVNYQAFSLSSHAAWWWNIPVSPMFMWIIGAAAYVAVVAGMIIYARARPGAADLAAPAPGI